MLLHTFREINYMGIHQIHPLGIFSPENDHNALLKIIKMVDSCNKVCKRFNQIFCLLFLDLHRRK